jgi:hypothetical protein
LAFGGSEFRISNALRAGEFPRERFELGLAAVATKMKLLNLLSAAFRPRKSTTRILCS